MYSNTVLFDHRDTNQKIQKDAKSEKHFNISKARISTAQPRFENNTEGKVTLSRSTVQEKTRWTVKRT